MMLKSFRWPCIIPLFVLFLEYLSTLAIAQENHKRRHESQRSHQRSDYIPEARWDIWGAWSQCSVDCGIGVTSRSRDCRSMIDGGYSSVCPGKNQEIKICETTGCIKEVNDSCLPLMNRMFGGKRYRWIPYKHPTRECEMACQPVGAGFFLGLGKNVSDGTPCGDKESHVCITGYCKPVGCDGVVESEATIDTCGVCNGDGTSCRRVHKTFTDNVKYGYHTITTIPRGSTNIVIKEAVGQSRNYLAIKSTDGSFQINTGFRLSRFGEYPAAGTNFEYKRSSGPDCPEECITAAGPTDVSVEIMILAYSDNKGIEYAYSMPTSYSIPDTPDEGTSPVVYIGGGRVPNGNVAGQNSENDQQKLPIFSQDFKFKKYHKEHVHAKHEDVSPGTNKIDHQHVVNRPTTTTLDTGQALTEEARETTTESYSTVVTEEDSESSEEDNYVHTEDRDNVTNRTEALQSPKSGVITEDGEAIVASEDMYNNDNRIPSLYSWTLIGYTECSQTCDEGKQYSIVKCIVTDKKVEVENAFCSELQRPSAGVRECNFGPCPPSWKPTPWSKCSVTCGTGYQSRDYRCTRPNGAEVSYYDCNSDAPRREERSCDMGSCSSGWYFTEWPENCPATCAYGTMTRRVHCFSDTGNERTACPERERPATEKTCRNDDCGGFWLTGPWSQCNATCGDAFQNRAVACAQRQGGRVTVVSDSACVEEERPATYMSCDLEPCGPEWFMNEWSKCSLTCGSGYRSRDVKCLDRYRQPSSGCDARDKPETRDPCKERECPPSDESRPNTIDERPSNVTPAETKPRPTESPADKTGCQDQFMQCKMVLQARLCQYKYYQNICCATCVLLQQNT